LLEKNYAENDLEDTPQNKIPLLIDILTIIEIDRVVQMDLNCVMVLELKQLLKGKTEADVDQEKLNQIK